jgi:uncharacterized protein (DUF433 family)
MKEDVEGIVTVDWSECDLVESVAGKVGGRPVVKGTRIPADTILTDVELGATVEETHESFPSLSPDTIRGILAYGHRRTRADREAFLRILNRQGGEPPSPEDAWDNSDSV